MTAFPSKRSGAGAHVEVATAVDENVATAASRTERRKRGPSLKAELTPVAMTVAEFCAAHRISKALFYLLLRDGRGPRVMKVGRRSLISVDAAGEWRLAMEAARRSES